ncbi:hypothetical protein [Pediococcus pentosaceus]|uniref:hypothetical protein n=1 Tax=Pediococcus pentosaceus TaxID=1255 RepID=UPI001E5CF6E2|nr:hypothetical protein [Pediococcus pentosaceus]
MDKEELLEYLEINSGVKDKFMEKALDYQNEKIRSVLLLSAGTKLKWNVLLIKCLAQS